MYNIFSEKKRIISKIEYLKDVSSGLRKATKSYKSLMAKTKPKDQWNVLSIGEILPKYRKHEHMLEPLRPYRAEKPRQALWMAKHYDIERALLEKKLKAVS